jgi:Flp pilus assembly protein TadG
VINQNKHDHHKKGQFHGQSLIELALLLPLIIVLVISAIELGRLFYTHTVITNAAREGAYYLSIHPTDYDSGTGAAPKTLQAAQREASNSGIGNITTTVTPLNCCTLGSYSVRVTVDTNVNDLLVIGFIGNMFSVTATSYDSFPLSASVEMLVQP